MTAVACTCGHDRRDHLLEHHPGQDPWWVRGPCDLCTGCDAYQPAGTA